MARNSAPQEEPEEVYSVPDDSDRYDLTYGLIEDRGERPDFDKGSLVGAIVKIVGISNEPEDFELGPVHFVKLLRVGVDSADTPPWGIMFAANSVVVRQVQKQVRAGHMPFEARFKTTPNKVKGYAAYWSLVPANQS